MSGSDEAVLSLEDVEVHFESNGGGLFGLFSEAETVRAVDGVSLDISSNQVVALVGESGCGKTTLGKTAIGLQEPTGGSVKYRGQDIREAREGRGDVTIPYDEIRRALQIIHQDPGSSLNPNTKVMAVLETPLKRWQTDLSREDRRARILGMLERVGMSPPQDYAGRYPHQLSGGEKQRVALVRALLMNPDVILADEAISALDVSLRIEMMDLFLELQDEFGTSFLAISHDLSNANYLAEKADGLIGVMYLGKLVEIGPAKRIIHDPKHPYTKALRWATPDLHPEEAATEMPMRKIDIPDPKNPPSGCRFHTRCPEVIAPDDVDIAQETFIEVMTYREQLADGEIDPEEVWAEVDPEAGTEAFVAHLFDALFETSLSGANRATVRESFEALAEEDHDHARAVLRERFESVCETTIPEPRETADDHPVACHLYDEGAAFDAPDRTAGDAAADD
ncbi:ATP-binding cassette domain-containing protein [Halomarina oriensis]|uniref:ATP-binding cassette domain-containing protein n=1 Tax=Halomarina oriensis TaxID=671145 RepID=A0A6B0GQB9_9EURY|nr:ATP-binding cassette domain-containing protein [Halomarina oriensis]